MRQPNGAESLQLSHPRPQTCEKAQARSAKPASRQWNCGQKYACCYMLRNFGWFDTQYYCSRDN